MGVGGEVTSEQFLLFMWTKITHLLFVNQKNNTRSINLISDMTLLSSRLTCSCFPKKTNFECVFLMALMLVCSMCYLLHIVCMSNTDYCLCPQVISRLFILKIIVILIIIMAMIVIISPLCDITVAALLILYFMYVWFILTQPDITC